MTDKPIRSAPEDVPVTADQPEACGLSRRDFLKITAVTGGTAAVLGGLPAFDRLLAAAEQTPLPYPLIAPENQISSVCLQCNTGCGIRVKLVNGVAAKIDGNPYSPWVLSPHLDYTTPLADAAPIDGALCPKGQAGLQTAYDPYRIVSV